MQKQSIDFHELFQHVLLEARAAWRYRWQALAVAWGVMIVGAALVFSLPNQYESNAQVYADTNALTNPLLQGIAVHSDVRHRLQVITRTLLARPNLATVADRTGLSLRASTPEDRDKLLATLGGAVKVKDGGATNLYDISYTDVDPQMAQKVVQAFVQILMNDTLGENTTSTRSAQNFLQQQVADYNDRLNDAEKKLADFRKSNIDVISGNYATRLQNAQEQLQKLQTEYNLIVASRSPGDVQASPQVQQLDQQIATYRQKLNQLLLRYTEAYPDVVSTRRMLNELQAQRKALIQDPRGTSANGDTAPTHDSYANQAITQALAVQIGAQKQRIASLRSNADKILEAQVTLQKLTRNYNTNKKQYDELLSRLNTAKMSQDAAQSGNNLKFRVISPPVAPLLPAGPHRGLLLLIAFLLAIGIGGAFAYFLHKIRPVFTSLKSLRDFDDHPVIGTFSLVVSKGHRRERRREVVGFGTGMALLVAALALGLAYENFLAELVQHVFAGGLS